jgi:hypothetical protein
MGSAGRRRQGRRDRRPGEQIRRPPFGAERRHWWEAEGAREWWLGEPAALRLLEEPAQDRLREKPAQRRWLDGATRHPWYTAIGAGATFLVLALSVIFVLPKHSPSAMTTVPLPAPSVPITVPTASPRMTDSPSPSATPRPSASPTASALPATMPSVMATIAPRRAVTVKVTVVYTPIEVWSGGMSGEFTVTNVGSNYVAGWELSAEFPGDQIQVTWGPIDPNPGSDTIVMGPQPDWPTIAPGTSQSGYFVAQGATIYPSTCTFDGASCI